MSDWISVEDRLPDKTGWYLAHTKRTWKPFVPWFATEETKLMDLGWNTRRVVAYWMPLPKHPVKG